jgi:aspartate aminotransferase-like enzyme
MEAVVGGCFCGEDRLLIVDGGSFGHRFAELSAHHEVPYESLHVPFGETLTEKLFGEAFRKGNSIAPWFTGALINHNETSTDQLYDMGMVSAMCREYGQYLVCDAISSFLTDPLHFSNDGIDALIISSQKALALPPGRSAVILSDRLYRKIEIQNIRPFALYFDFTDAEANAIRGQTPFTPAIGTMLALRDRLERIEADGGADSEAARIAALAGDFRARIERLLAPEVVELPVYPLSNACTPLVFPNGGAKAVYEKLSRDYGVWLNPNGGALADTVLRVGHIGNLTADDNAYLAELLSDIL